MHLILNTKFSNEYLRKKEIMLPHKNVFSCMLSFLHTQEEIPYIS